MSIVVFGFLLIFSNPVNSQAVQKFNIEKQSADKALTLFAVQTGLVTLFPYEPLSKLISNPLKGEYSISEAISIILEGTGFTGELTESGEIIIRRDGESAMTKIQKWLVGVIGATSVTGASLNAQEVRRGVLEEVIVTAQKRAESVQDIAVAVSAFSAKNLEEMGVVSTQDLQMSTPSLVVSNTNANAQPYLRGVGSRLTYSGLDPSVATYVGERYSPRAQGNIFELGPDVERVEVLKGPQGTLYGRNVTGGAIRIIKKDVEDEFGGHVKATYGNYNARILQGTVNVPVTEDFGFRLSGQRHLRDGYLTNIVQDLYPGSADEPNNRDFGSLHGKFRWDVTDRATAVLALDYWEQDDWAGVFDRAAEPFDLHRGVALGFETGRAADETATQSGTKTNGDELGSEFRFDYAFDSFDFVSVTTYADFKLTMGWDADGTAANLLDSNEKGSLDESDTFYQEFRLLSTNASPFQWIVGISYYSDEHTTELAFSERSLSAPNVSLGWQTTDTTAEAVFGQVSWEFSESWKLSLGGRYTEEEKKLSFTGSKRGLFVPGAVPVYDEQDWTEFTPKATIEYRWRDDSLAYLTYSRGFKSGGFNYPARGAKPLEPEILDMIELGVKSDFLDGSLRTNAALFFYDYTDLQVTRAGSIGGGAVLLTTENAADATINGLEADITWLPSSQLQVKIGFSVLDTEYDNYPASVKFYNRAPDGTPFPGVVDQLFDASGHDLLRVSDWSGYVNLLYEFNVKGGGVPVSLMYSYKDDFYFDFVGDPLMKDLKQDGYGLLSARIAYEPTDGGWSAALWGRNLTDEEYFADSVVNATGHRVLYAAPRTYGLDVQYNF